MSLNIKKLGARIGLGYAVMALLLATTVLMTIYLIDVLDKTNNRIMDQRVPTSKASTDMLYGLHHSASSLRGYVLTGDPAHLKERQLAWEDEILAALGQMEVLSLDWTNPENIVRLNKIRPLLYELKDIQTTIETAEKDQQIYLLDSKAMPIIKEVHSSLLDMVENQRILMSDDLIASSVQVAQMENIEWVILALGIISSFMLGTFITRSVTEPVSKAVSIAKDIGAGDLHSEIEISGPLEIETLGVALTEMRDELLRKQEANELYEWNTTGENKMYETVRGEKDLSTLSNEVIACLCEYLDCQSGTLYLIDEGRRALTLQGTYCLDSKKIVKNCTMGEGLIGQVAHKGSGILLESIEIEDDHLTVNSSLVNHKPLHVYIIPFEFNGETVGVIELGKTTIFSDNIKQFLDSIRENLGIAFNSAMTQQKVKELLEETQQQGEELLQQKEELEQSNEELEEQTQKLKEQQEELQVANEELEEQTQVVEQKNQDLETARTDIELKAKQLEISSKYKSEFLANMSHELRTPLNSLLILANDLANNKDQNLDEEQIESAQIIAKSGYDLLNLINEILDLSKIEAGKMDLNITEISFQDISNDLLRNFKRNAKEKGIALEVSLDESLPQSFRSDKQRLEQVLKNLLSNAIKFTEEGKVSVHVTSEINGSIKFIVSDTGIGIPKEKQNIVFEAFQQADGGTSRKYGGTGLGLSISRELVKLLGGKISLESTPNKGSSFTISIPSELSAGKSAEKQIKPVAKKVKITPGNEFLGYPSIEDQRDEISDGDHVVLIIEDDEDFARILVSQAKEKGFKYLTAASGEDGLLLAAQYIPSAIILDLELPGINGHMVLNELKGNPDLRHIPVHIMSASEKTLDLIRSGAVEFLSKPVSKPKLDEAFGRMEDLINRKMKNLLVIEDNEAQRKSILKLIGNGDVQCFEAATAKEALQQFSENKIDCIVLDIGLPDISGFELIEKLENNNGGVVPPIIVYTGRELTKEEANSLQEHAETVIIKGVKSDERLLDETALFLHRTVRDLPANKKEMITSMYDKETIFIGKKILIVDDDMRNVFALSKVLKEKGLDIAKADNGMTALKALKGDESIDMVLMDIMMPEMDGYECMKEIRKMRHLKELPIIALTAKAMKDDRKKCIDAGANDYITKPVDIERLLSLMRIWIKK
ncbi:MAG: response regulator [Bacteroidota bacterium]